MASMTLSKLKEAVETLSFDINTRVVLLVGKTSEGKYQFVQVTDAGAVVTSNPPE
jgi:hypothetical protein